MTTIPFVQNPAVQPSARPRAGGMESDKRWESAFKMEIPEFHDKVNAEEFLDWLVAVDEILKFKAVPDDRRASLVVTRFRGHAAAWWTQTKAQRARTGKPKSPHGRK